jgi:hypothetical protein
MKLPDNVKDLVDNPFDKYSHPCLPGCCCGRHSREPRSAETKERIARTLTGHRHNEQTRQKMSDSHKGVPLSEVHRLAIETANPTRFAGKTHSSETRRRIAEAFYGNNFFRGGLEGDAYAAILCPVGFVREFCWIWGPDRIRDKYYLDFAQLDSKTNIELDGPYHDSSNDVIRDARLRLHGWRVVRIQHD